MDKILSFYQDAKKLVKGELVIPRMVSIWPSNSCNLKCEYCGYANVQDGTMIDGSKMPGLIDEIVRLGVESIEFTGGGEPTVHPELFNFARLAYRKGLKVGMFTNGCNFVWDCIKFFTYIRVGLDAADRDSYFKIKKVNAFDKVIENIKILASRTIMDDFFLGVKFVITENNFENIGLFINTAVALKVDYVNFRKIFSSKNKKAEELADEIFWSHKDATGDFIYGDFDFPELKEPCFMAPIHAVIMADGSLLNCCYFNDRDHIIGNVFEKGFEEVWFSKRHLDILNSIYPVDCNKWSCRWREYNNQMRGVLSGKGFISFI